jgi:hypothetical protein
VFTAPSRSRLDNGRDTNLKTALGLMELPQAPQACP